MRTLAEIKEDLKALHQKYLDSRMYEKAQDIHALLKEAEKYDDEPQGGHHGG